jgi:cell division protein FtsL
VTGKLLDLTPLQVLQRQVSWQTLVLFVAVVSSALTMTYVSHLNREAFHQLQTELMIKNDLQEEWGQLLLQHGTLTAHGRVDRIAREKLDMDVPAPSQVQVIQP